MDSTQYTPFQIWMLAARPKTLPAAAAPVLVGTAVAVFEGVFNFWPVLAALLGALLIQIGTNFANDLFDYKKGADTHDRLGPTRVTQTGLLRPEEVAAGMWAAFGLAVLLGVYLVFVAGWPVLIIGVFSIAAGIAYTGGPFPLGYNGLGDLFVFLFFGLVAVNGTYFVQAKSISALSLWASIPVGLLATAILVVNNLRDIETDARTGKRTLAVRLGVPGTRIEYLVFVGGALVLPILIWVLSDAPVGVLLTWLSVPVAIRLTKEIYREKGIRLNKTLAGTGQLELIYALLFSLGLFIG